MISFKNVSFGYSKEFNVLKNINWKVHKGEVWGVLGHNGAGKSTMSYLTMNLLFSTSGIIKNTFEHCEYLPEFGGFYKYLTVNQNIDFKEKLNKHNIDFKEKELLIERLGLENYTDVLANKLSQGLRKRLAIGLILISNADLIYLDEPTNGLDPEMMNILKTIIIQLKSEGKTIIINTHDLTFIKKVASNLLILNEGEIIHNDTTMNSNIEELYFEKVGKKNV